MQKELVPEIQECNSECLIIILTSLSPIVYVMHYHPYAAVHSTVASGCPDLGSRCVRSCSFSCQRLWLLPLDTDTWVKGSERQAVPRQ